MPIVTLTTDFGDKYFYAGALKGAIIKECNQVDIVDISHKIEPFNIIEAAFALKNSYFNFPKGTIHVVTVNDMDSRNVRYLAVSQDGQYFLGFDNGIFSLVFDQPLNQVWELFNFSSNGIHSTFPGKSTLAKAAGHLAQGNAPDKIGKPVNEINQRSNLVPIVQDALIRGSVIYLDGYQNVVVNIKKSLFDEVLRGRKYVISFRRNDQLETISENYFDVPEGEKLCLFNSNGYLEIAINSGKAGSLLGLNIGDIVQIDFI